MRCALPIFFRTGLIHWQVRAPADSAVLDTSPPEALGDRHGGCAGDDRDGSRHDGVTVPGLFASRGPGSRPHDWNISGESQGMYVGGAGNPIGYPAVSRSDYLAASLPLEPNAQVILMQLHEKDVKRVLPQ